VLFVVSSIDSLQKSIVVQIKDQPEGSAPKK
jgi:hypothetical protein